MPAIAYLNGRFLPFEEAVIPIEERGHQFGDGVYEVVRVYGGRVFLLDWHLERLERSLAALAIDNPLSRREWVELIGEAVRRSQEAEAIVYWQVTRGIAARTHSFPQSTPSLSLTVRPAASTGVQAQSMRQPVKLLALPDERWANAYVKSVNLLPNVLAKESAHRAAAFEALLIREGTITEGSSSNIWFVRDGKLFTHPADRFILAGVTRRFIIDLAASLGLSVVERAFSLADLSSVEEMFLTGTTTEIQPVNEVVADRSVVSELSKLPQNPKSSLVRPFTDPEVLWAQKSHGVLTEKLQSAYQDAMRRFRLYESTLQQS